MDNVSKEIKEHGMIKTFLTEVTVLERAVTYQNKKIKQLLIEMKNQMEWVRKMNNIRSIVDNQIYMEIIRKRIDRTYVR